MAEILISNRIYNERQFKQTFGQSLNQMQCNGQHGVIWPYEINTEGQTSHLEADIFRALKLADTKNLYNLSDTLGEDNVVGVSKVMDDLRGGLSAASGSTAGAYAARSNKFVGAVKHYQDSLLAYRELVRSKEATGSALTAAKKTAQNAFESMQNKFRHELRLVHKVTGTHKARKGTPLNNSQRGLNIARSSRSIVKLNVESQVQAGALARYSNYGKVLGNGLAVIDFGSRVGNIKNEYDAGGNWEREMFIESTSFVTSIVAGNATVAAGSAALTFFAVATPVGWVGIILTAAAVTILTNNAAKTVSGSLYDDIMNWINSL